MEHARTDLTGVQNYGGKTRPLKLPAEIGNRTASAPASIESWTSIQYRLSNRGVGRHPDSVKCYTGTAR